MVNLVEQSLPDCALQSTSGEEVNLARLPGRVVVFIYPYTGRPGVPDPPGWDKIAGAHGSTPQALAFSKLYGEFSKLSLKVFGVSFQAPDWQREFVQRNNLLYSLLSDGDRQFANQLGLETFRAGSGMYLVRRAIVAMDGRVSHDFYPVSDPENNAADVLKVLQS